MWIVFDRKWACDRLGRHIDFAYSSKANAKRAVHDVKRNLLTEICTFAKERANAAEYWQKKYSELLQSIQNVYEPGRVHLDSYNSNDTTKQYSQLYEKRYPKANCGDAGSDESHREPVTTMIRFIPHYS